MPRVLHDTLTPSFVEYSIGADMQLALSGCLGTVYNPPQHNTLIAIIPITYRLPTISMSLIISWDYWILEPQLYDPFV